MSWYYIQTKNSIACIKFITKKYKGCNIWIPPEDLFERCIFVDFFNTIPEDNRYKYEKLTPDLYRKITDYNCYMVGLNNDKKIKRGKKVNIVSPLLSFGAKVTGNSKQLINIKFKIKKRNLKMVVPREFIR
jgi:hypothetical protein